MFDGYTKNETMYQYKKLCDYMKKPYFVASPIKSNMKEYLISNILDEFSDSYYIQKIGAVVSK
jgi:hypothetical protein